MKVTSVDGSFRGVAAADEAVFAQHVRAAAWRIRRDRILKVLPGTLGAAALVIYVWAWLLLLAPVDLIEVRLGVWLGLVAAALLPLIAVAVQPIEPRKVWQRLDKKAGLADNSLALGEWLDQSRNEAKGLARLESGELFWGERLGRSTAQALDSTSWPTAWPRRISRMTLPMGLTLVAVLSLTFWLESHQVNHFRWQGELVEAAALANESAVAALIEETRDTLQTLANSPNDVLPEALQEALAAQAEELSEDLAAAIEEGMTVEEAEREALLSLSSMEESLEEAREELQANRFDEASDALAAGLEPIEALAEEAASLRRRDVDSLAAALEESVANLRDMAETGESLSLSMSPTEAAALQEASAESLRGMDQEALAEMMEALAEATQAGEPGEMADALEGLMAAARSEQLRQAQEGELMSMMSMLESDMPAGGMPMSMAGGMDGQGLEAGTQDGSEPFGEATDSIGERALTRVLGQLGEGFSRTATMEAESGQAGAVSGAREVGFEAYDRMSFEAIEDESLPLSHRDAIRRYFERIRPTEGEGES